jgi:5-methylthioadenosine/S-adenosylhomocysteine deaminase
VGTIQLIEHGTVICMDARRRILTDATIAVEGDRIVWIGPSNAVPGQYDQGSKIDARGSVIYPGFVNIHTHAALSLLRGIGDDLGTAPAYTPDVPQSAYLSPDDCYVFSLLGGIEALRFGTTCMVDMYVHEDSAARAFSELGLRAVVSEMVRDIDPFKVASGIYEFDQDRGEDLFARNIELIDTWHGACNGRITCRLGPHAPDSCSPQLLQRIRAEADKREIGMLVHLAQSKREVQEIWRRSGRTPVEYLHENGILGPDVIAGHCIYISDSDIALLARTKTHVAHLSGSNSKGGMMAPIKAMVDKGINVTLGTDNMAYDMIEVMRLAVCVARMLADDPVALKSADVLEMATVNGAEALGMAEEIGSIEVGKKADLVIVDYRRAHLAPVVDPIANLVHNGLGSDVVTVLIDGRVVVANGVVALVDECQVIAEAQDRAESLWKAID